MDGLLNGNDVFLKLSVVLNVATCDLSITWKDSLQVL